MSDRFARIDVVVQLLEAAEDALEQEDPGHVVELVDEVERILAELSDSPSGAGERRLLLGMSADAARLRYAHGQEPQDLDDTIARLDTVHSLTVEAFTSTGPEGPPDHGDLVLVRRELALDLAERWRTSETGSRRSADADRVTDLLGPILDGPDVRYLPDPAQCRAVLGLVLSDRCRCPEHDTPERLADRHAAIGHLRTAHDCDDLDPDLRPAVAFDLALLSYLELGDRYQKSAHPAGSADPASECGAVLAVLRPLLADRGPGGADAAELGADVCDALTQYGTGQRAQSTAVDWYRAALAHPALPEEAAHRITTNLGLALAERSERNRKDRHPDDPAPAVDRAEAAALWERSLARLSSAADTGGSGTAPDDAAAAQEDKVACLAGIVDLLWIELSDGLLDDEGADRLTARARELAFLIGPDDTDRAELVLRTAIALTRRVIDRGMPYAYDLSNNALMTGAADPDLALDRALPRMVSDLREAIDLMRTGTGLYHHQDELHLGAQCLLGIALLLDFACALPQVRHASLRDALRILRVVLERAPAGSEFRDENLHGSFLTAMLYRVWYTDPFSVPQSPGGRPLPDVTGFPTVEDDLHLLAGLLDPATLEREPHFVFVSVMVNFLRAPDGTPSAADCRRWSGQLLRAAPLLEPEAWALRATMLAVAGALGLALGRKGEATFADRAAATAALREAHALLPPGSEMRRHIDEALRQGGVRDFQALLRTLFPAAAGPHRPAEPPRSRPEDSTPADARDDEAAITPPTIDPAATVLLGDGSPDPFAVPLGRVAEILAGDTETASAPEAAARSLMHYRRWLRERDGQDLTRAIALVRHALAVLGTASPDDVRRAGPTSTALADRCAEFLAHLLLDRHVLLGDHADLDAAVHEYDLLLDRTPGHLTRPPLHAVLAQAGDPRVPPHLFHAVERTEHAPFHAELSAAAGTAWLLLARSRRRHSTTLAGDAVRAWEEAGRTLPPDHPRVPAVRAELATQALREAREAGDAVAGRASVDALVEAATTCPAGSPHRPALCLRAAAALAQPRIVEGEPAASDAYGPSGRVRGTHGPAAVPGGHDALGQGIALLREAAEEGPHEFHGSRGRCLYGLGTLLLTRHLDTGRREDLEESVAVLREAWVVLNASPGDPFAIALIRTIALAHRAFGPQDGEHRRRSRETARSALTAYGRSVLLQSGADHGLEAARAIAPDMLRLVRWSLADGLPESAFEALELGRGLVLNAATMNVTVPDLLRNAGRHALADAWVRAATDGSRLSDVPDDLRRRVLEALAGNAAEKRLLSAPGPAPLGRTLRRLGTDALAYLVPGEDGAPGHAVIVTATGVVRSLRLPQLTSVSTGPVGAYAASLEAFQRAGRLERPAAHHPLVMHELHRKRLLRLEKEWQQALQRLCSWAGEAAMTPLLAAAEAWWPGRAPRIVLAPVGPLGIVPWHAARCPVSAPSTPGERTTGNGDHACERAVISYCASARQLIEVAARPTAVLGRGAVAVVVDPDGSPTMHREAALVASLHPEVTVIGGMGREGNAPGSSHGARPAPLPPEPRSLEPFLPGRGPAPTALLHINCHADTGPTSNDSVLKLDATHTVSVQDLLTGAAGRDPGMPGGTVLLANCTSDLTLSDHDEALTLATAFLGVGATAVVGSRWAVADDPRTMLLVLLVHHHMKRGVLPRDALRAAQLWMLDPDRILPPELAEFEALVGDTANGPLDELEVWASFTHHGQ
ncbi:CHAT domain-containing protein [Streptomyces europaeiscabiei]|uniref:CHAT domain-containing protein n=1 Tax=Streptomyces europaeiscabiei TaxID=146819 RepID=A0AAJ2PQD1_9ACTN|nr:CHAT domain-containing protein [Streptomyces europaeiscabiei]MDX3131587.1 CHAT domain-containing protein [Streptomyces europaeiscabiei]